ncbi:NADH-quinone oxidoreductase subunit J [Aldersonia sp. NBC_00410]|uniref:NADH-quinone oxidoreductase subunit J n=1 Tax=Aldersonia sp. NBC_00410 TaxID=2975954 RepID=UPI00225AB463|nr:NADH-quinone oxidoreductase subunit J [Aldersonia sp. NBC_00410]MCX5042864.1 NADH-quinone oxidoreductase subunit J [Aldersonia sp. NBC_00410]
MSALAGTVLLAAEPIVRTSTGEAVQFWILGAVAVIGALGVVLSPKAVYSAIFLAVTMIILAVFYLAQGAMFLGVVQIVVYTGAVMMLFLFVLMLVGVDSSDALVETLRGQRVAAAIAGIGFGILLIAGIGNATAQAGLPGFAGLQEANSSAVGGTVPIGNVEGLADLIFLRYVWAFELTGALLIAATVGAMILAHRERLGERRSQREMSQDRFRRWGEPGATERVTPLPSPGVYARHNAVDMPARLPDGSLSELSVNATLRSWPGARDRARAIAEATGTGRESGPPNHTKRASVEGEETR